MTSLSVHRVAAIADVHGNLPALEAALVEIETDSPDLIVVGGDVAAGPLPVETLDRLLTLGDRARFVRGNADRELVERYDLLRRGGAPPSDRPHDPLITWAANQLTATHHDFLASFAEQVIVDIAGLGPTLFCHGSPRSDEEIFTAATPLSRLRAILAGVAQPLVVCGHTHMQFDRFVDGTRVVNAGSVGMPYEGRTGAFWALLGPDVSLRRTEYDLEAAAARIRAGAAPNRDEFAAENVLSAIPPEQAITLFERMAEERRI